MKQTIVDFNDDPEKYHIKMDELMADLLRDLGYEKGIDIFDKVTLWYA